MPRISNDTKHQMKMAARYQPTDDRHYIDGIGRIMREGNGIVSLRTGHDLGNIVEITASHVRSKREDGKSFTRLHDHVRVVSWAMLPVGETA
jgi:hypothetical protein